MTNRRILKKYNRAIFHYSDNPITHVPSRFWVNSKRVRKHWIQQNIENGGTVDYSCGRNDRHRTSQKAWRREISHIIYYMRKEAR